jgi:hypothetical protein
VLNKRFIPLFVFILALCFYLYTLLPSLAWGDGVKLQSEAIAGESFVLAEMGPDEFTPDPFLFSRVGVAAWDHPLYIVLGHLLVRTFPFVDPLWLVNSLSALFGAASVALIYLLCYRFTGSLFASLYASLSLAVSHTFWWHSSTPEVYTLFVFLLLTSIYFYDRFESTKRHIFLAYSALFLGLAASTHIMAFLALPALGLYYIWVRFKQVEKYRKNGCAGGILSPHTRFSGLSFTQRKYTHYIYRKEEGRQQPVPQFIALKKPALSALGFLIGFSLYLLQFMRMSANFPLDEIMGPVVGSTFLSQLGTFSPILLGQSFLSYLFFLAVQFGLVGLVLGGMGLRRAFGRKDLPLRKLVPFFIVFALFGIFYRVTDQFTFFIPSYVFWAMLIGLGADSALGLLSGKGRSLFPVILGLLLLATPFFYTALPRLAERNGLNDASIGIPEIGTGLRNGLAYYINPNKRGDIGAYDFGYQTLSNLAPNSVIIAEWYTDTDEYFIFRYFTKIDKFRPDVSVIGWPTQDPFSFDSRLAVALIENSFPRRPVYLASLSEQFYATSKLVTIYCIVPENNLYRLYKKGDNGSQCLGQDFATE